MVALPSFPADHDAADLERRFGLIGGDIFHGRMSLDQLWAARPLFGLGSHRMPLDRLWLCGSGAHPGGGVSGRPDRNCAKMMLGRRRPPTSARIL